MKKFAVISDPQINLKIADGEQEYNLLSKCFRNMEVDFLIVCGDITENGKRTEWDSFFKSFHKNCPTKKIFLIPGNMDRATSKIGRNVYDKAMVKHLGLSAGKLDIKYEGDSFSLFGIAVDQDDDEQPLSNNQLFRLEETLYSAASRGIPTIVFGHYILNNTITINWEYAELGAQSKVLQKLFKKFSGTVIYFSGHIHRGLMQKPGGTLVQIDDVTYVSTPSICHPDNIHYKADNKEKGTGFIIELDENELKIKGFNFAKNRYLENFVWQISR